jgi:hypothetical protein
MWEKVVVVVRYRIASGHVSKESLAGACYAVPVNTQELVAHIDQEIERLQHARDLLDGSRETRRRPARKRTLSAAARARIAEAQHKRWAALRKQTKKS